MKSIEGTTRVCRQIVEAVGAPFELRSGIEVSIGASVGAALGRADSAGGAEWAELLARADRMLYAGKEAGRGTRDAGRGRFAVDAPTFSP